jgi:hypothetical protein
VRETLSFYLFKHIISGFGSGGFKSWQVDGTLEGGEEVDEGHASLGRRKLATVESHRQDETG